MTYEDTLAHIFSRGRFGIKPGLERVGKLLAALGNPHKCLRVVHIAGTNGKGSTAAFVSSLLRAAGVRTGLYTSPHLTSFTERIRIDCREIDEETVISLAERVIAAAPPETTFFELVTAMAFLHFAEEGVDIAIMEAGMGGRWDATNVADGILSVITPVSLDHCDYLGSTIPEIAREKTGIIKPGRPVVVALQADPAREVIVAACRDAGSRGLFFGSDFTARWDNGTLTYEGIAVSLRGIIPGIGGRYQLMNAACALATAELLAETGVPVGPDALPQGIEAAQWPGRMELFPGPPRILLDGAHNRAGAEALAEALDHVDHRRLLVVAGVMGDKDVLSILAPVAALAAHVYAVAPAIDRALPSAALARLCSSHGFACTNAGSVSEGLQRAVGEAGPEDLVLVCGSLFTVGEARSLLTRDSFRPFRG